MLRLRGVLLTILRLLGLRAALLSILAWYKRRRTAFLGKNTYDVKDYVKAKFPTVDYVDLVFPGPEGPKSIIKTAWVLPIAAQTASTGTLADFLRTLGATVTEVDLDAEDGDSDEEDKQDGNALVDDEAEEEGEEE